MTEVYRCGSLVRFPVGDGRQLVYSEISRSARILRSDAVQLLERCKGSKTLDDHALECCRGLQMSDDMVPSVKSQLIELANAGILTSDNDILERLAGTGDVEPAPPQIATVGCPTCNRLDALERCLISYIENCKQYGRTNDFVVVDDSHSAETRKACRELLSTLKKQYGVRISYAGLEEKTEFAQRLIGSGGLPSAIVNFALFDSENLGLRTLGANRNALSLHTLGDLIFCVDDDTMCRIAAPPEIKAGLDLISGSRTAGNVPTDLWSFPDRETALRSVKFVDMDALAPHEQLLGKDLRSCISDFRKHADINIDEADVRFLRVIQSGAGRVRVTLNGLVGDCCYSSPAYNLFLSDKAFAGLTQSDSGYRSALTSREVVRAVNRVTISDSALPLIATFFGLDNRDLLPPFMPVGRGTDMTFGSLLSQCCYGSYTAYIPWLLLHVPVPPRLFSPDQMVEEISGIDELHVLLQIILDSFAFGIGKADVKTRLRRLGSDLEQLGRMPDAEFWDFVRGSAWPVLSRQISFLERRRNAISKELRSCENDITQYIHNKRESMTAEEIGLPRQLLSGRSIDEARQMTQQLVLKFGCLLSSWPEIVEVAGNLRSEGCRLARPV